MRCQSFAAAQARRIRLVRVDGHGAHHLMDEHQRGKRAQNKVLEPVARKWIGAKMNSRLGAIGAAAIPLVASTGTGMDGVSD